ncbi:MAG: hypothetical protein LBC83_08435 [Oscillospiraceae bacterium]|jgi:hypothetical protein|nr:hypothetical protein [Oscillospiraceae bacterium]
MKKRGGFDYYGNLRLQGDCAAAAYASYARALGDCDLFALPALVERVQTECDRCADLRGGVTAALVDDFLPPMDRCDLLTLTIALFGVAEAAEGGLTWLFALRSGRLPEAFGTLGATIGQLGASARALSALPARGKKAMPELQTNCARIRTAVRAGRAQCGEALREIYAREANPRISLLTQPVEQCFATCAALANAMELALVRNL